MNSLKDFQIILDNFGDKVADVERLLVIDEVIIESTLEILKNRQENLQKSGIENAHMLGHSAITQLENIRNNESLKPGYKLIHNQCVVLLVSYFSSSIHDFFDTAVTTMLCGNFSKSIGKKELKFTLEELKEYDFNVSRSIGSIISAKFDISFQDMGSISRALNEYLLIDIPWDRRTNNIITMQACRHAIAHAGECVDERLLNQLRKSHDRDIQRNLSLGEKIQFTPEEVKLGGREMINYFRTICSELLGQT